MKPRHWVLVLVLAAIALQTGYLNWITLRTVWTAKSEVPWRDQWVFLDDVKRMLEGEGVLSRLWDPYWGHRPVITRLITLVDVRYFSGLNTPIIALILALQAAHAALLCYVAWRLFHRLHWPVFLFTSTLIFHLSLSSLQLENLIFANQAAFILVGATATVSFFLLALYATQPSGTHSLKRGMLLGGSMLAAFISALSRPDGVLVWLVLLIQAFLLRLSARLRVLLALAFCLSAVAYLWGYEQGPPMGMGIRRAILHPEQSLPLVGLIAVGPLSVNSEPLGTWLGGTSLLFALYAILKTFRTRPQPPAMLTVNAAVAAFSLATMWMIVAGRISPEFIAERVGANYPLLPSRYFTTPFFFWASMSSISAWLVLGNRRTWPQLGVVGLVTVALTFGTTFQQITAARIYGDHFRKLDVAATALIMDVPDPANLMLEEIYPDEDLRSRIRDWLEREKLSIFHERRAHLMGLHIVPSQVEGGRCQGSSGPPVPVNDGVFRVSGWVWDFREKRPPRDLVFVDSSGIVVGLARSGLRRPDLRGSVAEDYLAGGGWEGYVRSPNTGRLEIYGVLSEEGHYCRVSP